MAYAVTATTKKLALCRQRIRAVAGGTSAGKTISILQLLIDEAQTDTHPTLTSVVSESFPHLRRGAMKDFLHIMQEHGYFIDDSWSKSEFTYVFPSGSKIEFFSADQASKVRGPRRDRLFLNECNNVPYEAYDQLVVRTKEYIWLDWNPTSEFWFYTAVIDQRSDVDFCTVTYKDNEALSDSIVYDIESHRENKAWWQVYGLGQLGEIKSRIYTDWQIIDRIPHEARLERRGLDFGFSRDPAVLIDLYYFNGGYIVDELAYSVGMFNRQIADLIQNQKNPYALCIGDSAEPKSIAEMSEMGINIIGAEKGAGSRNQGIRYVQEQRVSVTKRSLNIIKSYRNYIWKSDKNGELLSEPDHYMSDGMDAVRYAMETVRPRDEARERYNTGDLAALIY